MTLIEAKDYINSLITEGSKPSHIKIYNRFNSVLDFLEEQDLSKEAIEKIEKHLDSLELKAESKRKHIYVFKKYSNLTTFLKQEFGFVTDGHYASVATGTGIAMGMSLGMSFGIAFSRDNGLIYGMLFGMMIGLIFGSAFGTSKDKEAKKSGKVIPNTKQ